MTLQTETNTPSLRQDSDLKAILFDMDGVLFDTERLLIRAWHEAADELAQLCAVDIDIDSHAVLGKNDRDTERYFQQRYGDAFPYWEYMGKLREQRLKIIEHEGVPMKLGAEEILARCRDAGLKTALVSSTKASIIADNLERTGLDVYFDAQVNGEMVECGKPAPDPYLIGCNLLGTAPARSAAVEDSFNGIRSAHAAGLHPLMVVDILEPTDEIAALAECCCHSLDELSALLFPAVRNASLNAPKGSAS